MASPAFNTLFTQHAMASYAKQLTLADAIEGAGAWDLDVQAGTLSFAEGRVLKISLLGSYGAAAESWLWAWANRNMSLPPEGIEAATTLRERGRGRNPRQRDLLPPSSDGFRGRAGRERLLPCAL